MFYALVKFRSNPVPVLYAAPHVDLVKPLATMEDVEWVTAPIAMSGRVIGDIDGSNVVVNGLGAYVIPYTA